NCAGWPSVFALLLPIPAVKLLPSQINWGWGFGSDPEFANVVPTPSEKLYCRSGVADGFPPAASVVMSPAERAALYTRMPVSEPGQKLLDVDGVATRKRPFLIVPKVIVVVPTGVPSRYRRTVVPSYVAAPWCHAPSLTATDDCINSDEPL